MKIRLSIILSLIIAMALGLTVPMQTTRAAPTATIVYDATSNPLPPNLPSLGFQATQTSEFGDYVHLGGTNRALRTVTVTMSDWALYSNYASDARYAGNSTTWAHPITLNIYNVVPGTPNTVGALLATITQVFEIPWRPVADPTCSGGTAWRASDGQCYNGLAFNITFDMSSLNVTLPNDVIVGVAYNTQTYGTSPVGTDGPYNSLNVGVLGATTVGSDDNTNNVFWNTSTAGWYADGGAGGVGIFREDTNWTPNGTVNIQVTAAPTVPSDVYVDAAWTSVPSGQDPDGSGPASQMGYDAFTAIQAGVNAVASSGTVHVAAGTYIENVNVNKLVKIIGAGSGTSGTVLTNPSVTDYKVGVVQLAASGTAVDPILLQDLRIQPVGLAGLSVGRFTESTGVNVDYLTLNNVHVVGTNTSPCSEQERGLYVDLTSSLRHLTINNSAFDNLHYGWYLQKAVSADTSTVQYVTVTNTTFNHNNIKGIYAEKLSDATFTDVTADGNGFGTAADMAACSYFLPNMAGIDINTKAGTYQNLTFNNLTATNNANIPEATNGVNLAIKARGTGSDSSYGSYPATLNNVVVTGGVFTGSKVGIRTGEPGKNNTGPTGVTVTGATIQGNGVWGLNNQTTTSVNVERNYWGSTDPIAVAGVVNGSAEYQPWCNADFTSCSYYPSTISMQTSGTPAEVGEIVTMDSLITADGVYGIQLRVSFDPTELEFQSTGSTHNDVAAAGWYWDQPVETFIAVGNSRRLSGTMSDPPHANPAALTGQSVATWKFKCLKAGTFTLTYDATAGTGTYLATKDGFSVPATLVNATVECRAATASVNGYIKLQGRLGTNPSPAGWNNASVVLTCVSGGCTGFGPYTLTTDATGHYQLVKTTPGSGIVLGTYSAAVSRRAYLGATKTTNVTIVAGSNTINIVGTAPTLLGGDVVAGGGIALGDITAIGGTFGNAVTPDTGNDVNGDGFVNIFDLVMAGGNFEKMTSAWMP